VKIRIRSKKVLIVALVAVVAVGAGLAVALLVLQHDQTTDTDDRDYTGIPTELQGTWCSATDKSKCINFADLRAWWPEMTVELTEQGDEASRYYEFCLEGEPCSTSTAALFEYLPVGVGWNCEDVMEYFDSCKPDYTDAHDVSKPRVRLIPSHQQNEYFIDTEPLYLDPSATGTFGDIYSVDGW